MNQHSAPHLPLAVNSSQQMVSDQADLSLESCLMDTSGSEGQGKPPCMALFASLEPAKSYSTPRQDLVESPGSSCSNADLNLSPNPMDHVECCDSGLEAHSAILQQQLTAMQEQEQAFHETVHMEEVLFTRRREWQLLRTAPAKLAFGSDVCRVLTFDDEAGPPSDAHRQLPQPSTPVRHTQTECGTPELLRSLRSEQTRLYQNCHAIGRLPGSNINRGTPAGKRRLLLTPGQGPRRVDERLLNSARLFYEFDLTDEDNTRAIASGSFGFVFTAVNRLDGVVYCLKTAIPPKGRHEPSSAAQTREAIQEVWAMAGMSERHSNFVAYYGCWMQFDRLYIKLEYCNGLSLHQFLDCRRKLPGERLRQMVKDIGSALAFMHSEGLAHLDCSTSNILMKAPRSDLPPSISLAERHARLSEILVNPRERLLFKLGDFGHARDTADVENLEDGTGKFMPMDALDLSQHPDPRLVDNFSLGLCVIEAAGGHVPESTDSPMDGEARLRLLERGEIAKPADMDDHMYQCVLALLRPAPLGRLSLERLLHRLCADLLDAQCLSYLG